MSTYTKAGHIISIEATAVHDHFVGEDVVNLTLKTLEGEEITARYIPRGGFRLAWRLWKDTVFIDNDVRGDVILERFPDAVSNMHRKFTNDPYFELRPDRLYGQWDILVCPAVGDYVTCGWDYGQFSGEIVSLDEPYRQPVGREFEVIAKHTAAIEDILNSLDGGN